MLSCWDDSLRHNWRFIDFYRNNLLHLYEIGHRGTYDLVTNDSPPPPNNTLILHFISGGVAGMCSRTLTAPIDRIRLVIQTLPKKVSIQQVFLHLIKEGGVLSLWRGNSLSALKVGPEMAIRFAAYERIKRAMSETETHSLHQRLLAGACAGIIGNSIIYPMEVMKTRMVISKTGDFSGLLDAVRKIYTIEGLAAFYRGYPTSCMGLVPYTGIDLALFETLKREYIYKNLDNVSDRWKVIWKSIPCGVVSTTIAQCAAYPFYLIKFRQQGLSKHPSNLACSNYYVFAWVHIMRHILRSEGIAGLYRGLLPTLCKVVPTSCIHYFLYESIQITLQS